MNKRLSMVAVLALASTAVLAQENKKEEKKESAAEQRAENRAGHEMHKADADRITNGPVIESVSDRSAVIAWSTNAKSSSVLMYGTDQNGLSQKAQAPWGGRPHRVYLKNLQPNTTYYFRVHSGEAQGTGTAADSPVYNFKTVAKGAAPNRQNVNVGVKK